MVPFIVLPESDFVDITSTSKATTIRFCGSLLAGILASRFLARLVTGEGWVRSQYEALWSSRSTYFILVTAAIVVVVSLLSLVLSIAPGISLWGRNHAGFEAGEYTALMYVVFAIAVLTTSANRLRSNVYGRPSPSLASRYRRSAFFSTTTSHSSTSGKPTGPTRQARRETRSFTGRY